MIMEIEVHPMRPSLLLNDARLSHDILVRELKAIYEKLDDATKADLFDNKVERLIVPFDLTLQFDLLKLALASKKKEESLAFLRGMGYFHYDILKFQEEYMNASGKDKDDTFLGKFFDAAIRQKGMVTNRIYHSGSLLAGYSLEE